MNHSPSLQEVLPIPSPCPLGNSNQNVSVVPSSPLNSPEVASPPLITYQHRTRQVGSTVPEASSRDPHPSSTNPQPIDPTCLVLCWYVMRGGGTTLGEFGGEDGTTLTFWSELPRGQGEGIRSTTWREEEWSMEGWEEGCVFKEGYIRRYVILFCGWRVALVTFLKMRITQKDTFDWSSKKFV